MLHLFRVEDRPIQRAFQLALQAFYMSASEMERFKIGRIWRGVKIQNTFLDLTPLVSSLTSRL